VKQERVAIIPARNESKGIAKVLNSLSRHVDHVIVVDDGSEDSTGAIARGMGAEVIRIDASGVGAATVTGLESAKHRVPAAIVTLDADGQHDPNWIEAGLQTLAGKNVDVVFADRFQELEGVPLTKQISNNIAWAFVRQMLKRVPVTRDVSCGFRIYGPRGLSQVLGLENARTRGYAFVQSSYVWLCDTNLQCKSISVPAVYPIHQGTPMPELRQFLQWAANEGPPDEVVRELSTIIDGATNARFALTSWLPPHVKQEIMAIREGDQVVFRFETTG